MKVDELREILKKYNEEEKEKIIVELYKKIPKSVKEDSNIDEYIINLKENKKLEKASTYVPMKRLEKEVNYFLDCVDDDLYVKPNRVIPKSERSKWKRKVNSYYKQLNNFSPETEDGKKATNLLAEIFYRLSYGTRYLLFSSWNTFSAVKTSQTDFLDNIMQRKLINGITKENIEFCVDLLEAEHNFENNDFIYILLGNIKTIDAKYILLDLLKEKVNKWQLKYKNNNRYDNDARLDCFIESVVCTYFNLGEVKKGKSYFHTQQVLKDRKNSKNSFVLTKLFDLLEVYNLYEDWIEEYEKYKDNMLENSYWSEKYKKIKENI